MSTIVAEAVTRANLCAATLSADDATWATPWSLLHAGGWLSTAAAMAVQ